MSRFYRLLLGLLFLVGVVLVWRARGARRSASPVSVATTAASVAPRTPDPGPTRATPAALASARVEAWDARREMLERFAYAQDWAAPQPAAMTAFREWTERFLGAAGRQERTALEAEGVLLARARRQDLRWLIERDPQRALAATVPAAIRQQLPAAVLAELETRVAGRGDYLLLARTYDDAESRPTIHRTVVVGGERYVAHPFGRREAQLSKEGASLHGVALDGHLALHESPLRVLEPGEIPAGVAAPNCPVSGDPVAPLAAHAGVNEATLDVVEAMGRVWKFSAGDAMLEPFEATLLRGEAGSNPRVQSLAANGPLPTEPALAAEASTSHTIGTKQVLVIRVDFSDVPGDPIFGLSAQAIMDTQVKPFFESMSYGKTTLVTTISNTYRLPQTASSYALADNEAQLHTDARALASADHAVTTFDRIIVLFANIGTSRIPGSRITFAGEGSVGGTNIWINGATAFALPTLSHELGHTFGLAHANLWRVTDGNPISSSGTSLEYGDPFDDMGSTSVTGVTRDNRHHFSPWAKNRLGWLPDSAVTSVTTSGTYRIYRFDAQDASLSQPLALRIFRDGVRSYWVGLRQNFAAGSPSANDAYVFWGYNNRQRSELLDLNTPGVNALDAALAIGNTFSDPAYGITIKPLARGGEEPAQWLDVEVTVPAAPPNVVQAWGREGAYFSDGANGFTNPAPETYVPWGLVDVRAIAVGDLHALALKSDGTVVAWGDTTYGQTTVPANLGAVVQIAAGKNVSGVLLANGTVRLWGDGTSPAITALPAGLSGVSKLALGYDYGLALKTDGTVVAWGANGSNQTNVPAGLTNVMAIAAGDRQSTALKTDGTVIRWGSVNFSVSVPPGLRDVTALSCNGGHVMALKADGTVVAWGNNANGQSIVPTGLKDVVAIAAGGFHSMALKSDGSTVAWGSAGSLQTTPAPGLRPAYAIAAGLRSNFALVGPRVFITAQPQGQTIAAGGNATLSVGAVAGTVQWQRNGAALSGSTNSTLTLPNLQPAATGIYTAAVTSAGTTAGTQAAIIGLSATTKVVGTGTEVGTNIAHANGNVFDQILLQGAAASFTADAGQITRLSFLDAHDDIVQVEFGGAGTVSVVLDASSGPAPPVKYNQPTVTYMKGHVGIVVTGANETSNLSVFSVGRANAVNQALFRSDVTYDGFADLAFIAIASPTGKFGGLRTANASYFATRGLTGVYAPGVEFTGPVFVGDISASDNATPVLVLGSASDVRITGGDLQQANGRAIQVSGLTRLQFAAGSTSHGTLFAAQANRARLEQNGVDITAQVAVNP